MPFIAIVIYAVAKYLAYSGWCTLLPDAEGPWWRRAFGLGLARLLVGVSVGAVVALAGAHLTFASRMPLAFGAILLPIRWLEWNVVATIGLRLPLLPHLVILGPTGKSRLWTAGGIVVSFATDVLAILAMGSMRALVC